MSQNGLVEAPHVDAETTATEIVPVEAQPPATLFRTDDPVEVVRRATEVATALKQILASQRMVQRIRGREHVKVEGWQTLGSMLGVVPVVVWTRPIDDGWEARVEARTLDGRVVGAAEAMCTRAERLWRDRDPFALRSMAQTRATSKALRGPLGFIVTLAGYDATPAEEMQAEPAAQPPAVQPPADTPTREEVDRCVALAREAVDAGLVAKSQLLMRLTAAGAQDTSSISRAFATCHADAARQVAMALADAIADAADDASLRSEQQEAPHER